METALPPTAGKNPSQPAPTNGAAAAGAREGLKPSRASAWVAPLVGAEGDGFFPATGGSAVSMRSLL